MSETLASSNNTKAVKNAIMLALRMVFVTLIGLYTSRVVLRTLGIEDYGVYAVAGGFIGVISFINTTMAGATNRFLCVEMGRSGTKNLSKVFSCAFVIHIAISVIVVLLAETIGLWFLNYRLNIPVDRMYAANWVYQCSIVSIVFNITQTPYSAVILAREKMRVYAYFEILNSISKLGIIALLVLLPGDKLIIYAILVAVVALVMRMANRLYCIQHFPESRFIRRCDKDILHNMLKFSATDLYGNVCYIGYVQSRAIVLNIFYGVVYNTAASLAYTIQSLVSAFASTITQAFRPQILKLYAVGNILAMQSTMEKAMKFNILVFAIISVPCIFEANYILELWLGEIPRHLVLFLRIILMTAIIAPLSGICVTAIHATGKIKSLSYITGSLYISIPIITCIAFNWGAQAWWLFLIYGITMFLITTVDVIIVKRNISQFEVYRFVKIILMTFSVVLIGIIPVYGLKYLPPSFFRVLLTIVVYLISVSILSWRSLFNEDERRKILLVVKTKLKL